MPNPEIVTVVWPSVAMLLRLAFPVVTSRALWIGLILLPTIESHALFAS